MNTTSVLGGASDISQVPIKMVGQPLVRVGDVAPQDAFGLQYNTVRVNGQRGVYLPIFKQGVSYTIANGVRDTLKNLVYVTASLRTDVELDQFRFVKQP